MGSTTPFSPALDHMELLKSDRGELLTKPFLDVCMLVLPLLAIFPILVPEKFGAAMTVVKSDISSNISRLESKYSSNMTRYRYLYSIVQSEVETKSAKSSSSCTNGLLWLTRAMDFLVEMFRNLCEHRDWSLVQACNDAYSKTLKKWHGWLASSSFTVAMKLVPDRKKLMEVLGNTETDYEEMEKFCTTFTPTLAEIHKFLASFGLDSMKAL